MTLDLQRPFSPIPPASRCLHELSTPQQTIVELLSHGGEQTVDELATWLELTASAVRQHLSGLEEEQLVVHGSRSNGRRGRPRRYYSLTVLGEQMLPGLSGQMAMDLVDELLAQSPELVIPVLRARMTGHAVAQIAELPDSSDTLACARACLEGLTEAGYRPAYAETEDGAWELTLHHCPIRHMADISSEVCAAELESIRTYHPGSAVDRIEHRLAGDRHCTFRIRSATNLAQSAVS